MIGFSFWANAVVGACVAVRSAYCGVSFAFRQPYKSGKICRLRPPRERHSDPPESCLQSCGA